MSHIVFRVNPQEEEILQEIAGDQSIDEYVYELVKQHMFEDEQKRLCALNANNSALSGMLNKKPTSKVVLRVDP